MVICQYFLRGRCYFGENCRNEHIIENANDGRDPRNQGNTQQTNPIRQISNEVTAAEKGGQWMLTCFGPVKEGPCVPGLNDVSPEEVRWTLYDARKNGTVNQAMSQITQLQKIAEQAREAIKHPTPEMINILNAIIAGKKPPQTNQPNTAGSFLASTPTPKSSFRFDSAVNNIFGNTTPNQTPSIFGGSSPGFQSQSIFGNAMPVTPPTNPPGGNIFAQPQTPPTQGIFSQPVTQNVFGMSENRQQNVFTPPSQNIFQPPQNTNIFSSGFQSPNVFGNAPAPAFQQQPPQQPSFAPPVKTDFPVPAPLPAPQPKDIDISVYSRMEDLNENEIKAFSSPTFTFGNIPLKPPPQQYC